MRTRSRDTALLLLLLAPVAWLPSCGDSGPAAHGRQQSVEAWAALKAYGDDQREAFTQELNARLALLDRQLDELKARSARSGADAKRDIEHELDGLQARRSELAERLSAVKVSSKESWTATRDATVDAFQSLADGINAAAEKFAQ
jgi:hypothetical protein